MSSKTPVIRQIEYWSLFPQLLLLAVLMLIFKLLGFQFYLAMAAGQYILLSFLLRSLLPIDHRKGILAIRKKEYRRAIDYFHRSYEFFSKNLWLDRYRSIILLSSSAISYREMALVNIAFCHTQLAEGQQGKDFYRKTLNEFPNSQIASTGFKMLESMVISDSMDYKKGEGE